MTSTFLRVGTNHQSLARLSKLSVGHLTLVKGLTKSESNSHPRQVYNSQRRSVDFAITASQQREERFKAMVKAWVVVAEGNMLLCDFFVDLPNFGIFWFILGSNNLEQRLPY